MSVTATDLRVLRAELTALREIHPRRSSVVAEAFGRLLRAGDAAGQPIDALRIHTRDEVERFFARTIPGVDGHVYWDGGPKGFVRNDGKIRAPRRWWYSHKHGAELGPYEDFVPTCGELNCITPEHCQVGRGLRRRRFTDEQMLNAVKVAALRIGHAPASKEWDKLGLNPSRTIYTIRFGHWENVIRKAGLEYIHPRKGGVRTTPAACVASLRHLRAHLGHWPNEGEFRRSKEILHAAHLPAGPGTIRKHLGLWNDALRKAGKR